MSSSNAFQISRFQRAVAGMLSTAAGTFVALFIFAFAALFFNAPDAAASSPTRKPTSYSNSGTTYPAATSDDRIVDILVVYGNTYQEVVGDDGAKAYANAAIEYANLCYENSGIDGAVRLSDCRHADYNDTPTLSMDLAFLTYKFNDGTNQDPYGGLDMVHDWRDELGADFVVYVRNTNDGSAGGLAWYLDTMSGMPTMAFGVVCADNGFSTFPHEVGHGMGGMHDWGTVTNPGLGQGDPNSALFPYAFGYILKDGNRGTVMSYSNEDIPYFSNPDLTLDGEPLGVPETETRPANNAKTLNQTIPVVAAYRAYKPGLATPVINPAGGRYNDEVSVSIEMPVTDETGVPTPAGVSVYYTIDGTDPDQSSGTGKLYTEPFLVKHSTTVKARAFASGARPSLVGSSIINIDYGRTLAPVTFSPEPGTYKGSVTVTLATETPGAVIRYTTNGDDVTETSAVYRIPNGIVITGKTVIKAKPFAEKYNLCEQSVGEYTLIGLPQVEAPVINLTGTLKATGDGREYLGPVLVSFDINPLSNGWRVGDVIRYTTDNSEVVSDEYDALGNLVRAGSPVYLRVVAVASDGTPTFEGGEAFYITRSTTIRARVWRTDYATSETRRIEVIIDKANSDRLPRAEFSPLPGIYADHISVSLAISVTGILPNSGRPFLRYTLDYADNPNDDGIEPDENSPIYDPATPIVLTKKCTIRVKAFDIDFLSSETATATYDVRTPEGVRVEFGAHVAGGADHSLFLSDARALRATGSNRYGQLGYRNLDEGGITPSEVATPVSIYESGSTVSAIAAGEGHTLIVTRDNELYTAGRNNYGQRATGDRVDSGSNPNSLDKPVATNVVFAAAGGYHTLYSDLNGSLYVAGRNNYGQLGLGTADVTDQLAPARVLKATEKTFNYATGTLGSTVERDVTGVVLTAGGTFHSFYICGDGSLWAFGRNDEGQLGTGDNTVRRAPVRIHTVKDSDGSTVWLGTKPEAPEGKTDARRFVGVRAVAAGRNFTIILTDDGRVFAAGANDAGQIGQPSTVAGSGTAGTFVTPVRVATLPPLNADGNKIVQIAAGEKHALFLTADGRVFGLGSNLNGQLGGSPEAFENTLVKSIDNEAVQIEIPDNPLTGLPRTVNHIAAGSSHSIFKTAPDEFFAIGKNTSGQLGDGSHIDSYSTADGPVPDGTPVVTPTIIPAGGVHTGTVSISITGIADGAIVRYTIQRVSPDGEDSKPVDTDSAIYKVPFLLEAETADVRYIVRARAFRTGKLPSDEAVAEFTVKKPLSVTKPQILAAPESKTVVPGTAVSFTVRASGDPAPSFQWYFNDQIINGATLSTYTVENATAATAGTYSVSVANAAGTETASATLDLYALPNITSNPRSESPTIGSDVELSVTVAYSKQLQHSYQWLRDGSPVTGAAGTMTALGFDDSTGLYYYTASLKLTKIGSTQSGSYTVTVSNVAGTVTSSAAEISVHSLNGAPVFTRQPSVPAIVWSGNKLTISAAVNSSQDVTYQWQHKAAGAPEADWAAVIGAVKSEIVFTRVSAADNGDYRLIATNAAGEATSNTVSFTVRQSNDIVVLTGLDRMTGFAIGTAFNGLFVEIEGDADATPSAVWYFNNSEIAGVTTNVSSIPLTEAKEGRAAWRLTLPFYSTTAALRGHYAVEVTSGSHKVVLGPTALVVVAPPKILSAEQGVFTLTPGEGKRLAVETRGSLLKYVWKRDGVVVANTADYYATESGKYTVTISNGAGEVTQEVASIRSSIQPGVLLATKNDASTVQLVTGYEDENASLNDTVTLVATVNEALLGGAPFTYEWYRDRLDGRGAQKIPELSPSNPEYGPFPAENAIYYVKVSNAVGTTQSNSIGVSALSAPKILRQPYALELTEGGSGVLEVSVEGTAPLSFQWYRNGTRLPGGVNPIFVITDATTASAGSYTVEITNPATSVKGRTIISRAVDVTVAASVASGGTTAAAPLAAAATTATSTATAGGKSGTFVLGETSTGTAPDGLAPLALPVGTRITLNGVINETTAAAGLNATGTITVTDADASVIEILANQKLPNGDYTYIRTGPNTATLAYSITYGDASFVRVETGLLDLVFTTAAGGSYILQSTYDSVSNSGSLSDGLNDGEGSFDVK